MPSKSKAQAQLMQAVAHNPKFAKKVGINQSVGKDFVEADKKKIGKNDLHWRKDNKPKEFKSDRGEFAFR